MSVQTVQTRIDFGNAYVVVGGSADHVLGLIEEEGQTDGFIHFLTWPSDRNAHIRVSAITGVWELHHG